MINILKNHSKIEKLISLILIFIISSLFRSIPEFMVGTYPVGYDTVNSYVPSIVKFDGDWLNVFTAAPLTHIILMGLNLFIDADFYFVIKVFAPFLTGMLIASFYLFCLYYLNWNLKKCFTASLLLLFQIPLLRLSWDLLRNQLGLIFFFLALIQLKNLRTQNSWKTSILFSVTCLLVILSHQLVSVLLFFVIFGLFVKTFIQKDSSSIKYVLYLIPSVIVFAFMLSIPYVFSLEPANSHIIPIYNVDFIFIPFLTNYVKNSSYVTHILTIAHLFAFCFGLIIIFSIYGFRHTGDSAINLMTIWLLFASLASILFAGVGVLLWDRWMYLLVFPFTIYAVNGLEKIRDKIKILNISKKIWKDKIRIFNLSFWLITLFFYGFFAATYVSYPTDNPFPLFVVESVNSGYAPPTLQWSSINFKDIPGTINCAQWLNQQMMNNSVVLVPDNYRGWVIMNLDLNNSRWMITYPWNQLPFPQSALNVALEKDFNQIYLIGLSNQKITHFNQTYTDGNIAIYTYNGKNNI